MTDAIAKAVTLAVLERGVFCDNMRSQYRELRKASNAALQWMRFSLTEVYRQGWDDAAMNRNPRVVVKGMSALEAEWYAAEKYVDLTEPQEPRNLAPKIQFVT